MLFSKKEIIKTNKKYSDYLPVGTIIKINNDDNLYMIYVYLGNRCRPISQSSKYLEKSYLYNKENKNKYYHIDYEIITYPIDMEFIPKYIMHEDIKDIIHMGYNDEYRKQIFNDIDEMGEL